MPRKTKNVVFAATYKINEKGEEFTVGFDICKKFDKFTKRDQEKIKNLSVIALQDLIIKIVT